MRSGEEECGRRESTQENKHSDHTGLLLTFKAEFKQDTAAPDVCVSLYAVQALHKTLAL